MASDACDYSLLFDTSATGPLTNKRCINLDNGASTQPTLVVMNAVNNFMKYYSSAHRGSGFKSQITTWAYEEARVGLLRFVQAKEDQHLCIFTKNTTESVNLLAARFPFVKERNVILISSMEHHSSDLPWRKTGHTIVYIAINKDGTLDMDDLQNKVSMYGNSLALVCVSGASNVTGILNPIYKVARIAHSVGAQVYIDCAQLVSRRAIDVKDLDDPEHLDYIAFAGHKMYAPFGSAVLIGRKDAFSGGTPFLDGGGAVNIVTLVNVTYKEGAEKEEAGSPNTVGAYAMFIASKQLQQITFSAIENHERALMEYALPKLQKIPGLKLAGGYPVDLGTRGGVISFTIDNIHFNLVAAILGTEFDIAVRAGCFCAHPYVMQLLEFPGYLQSAEDVEDFIRKDINNKIGYIRLSFGLGNTFTDVDLVVDALKKIVHGEYKFKYIQDEHGEFSAAGVNCDFSAFVSLDVEPLKHPTRMTLKTVFLEWKENLKKWMKMSSGAKTNHQTMFARIACTATKGGIPLTRTSTGTSLLKAVPVSIAGQTRSYHEKVIDHYENPRNVGSLPKSDPNVGTGVVGAPACGDVMKLQILVNEETGEIQEVKFKTFGCGSAIASSSFATEKIKGMKVWDAKGVKNTDIAKELSLPPVKLHCSMLAEDAIKSAVKDWETKRAARLGGKAAPLPGQPKDEVHV
ncbi:hypothetical protein HDU79_006480 [Rhizoclosmatium sp. JEL0117]|nr:hypothetical protein HDU79_006480 [Rhizoclosmatium sp. JEL0117]